MKKVLKDFAIAIVLCTIMILIVSNMDLKTEPSDAIYSSTIDFEAISSLSSIYFDELYESNQKYDFYAPTFDFEEVPTLTFEAATYPSAILTALEIETEPTEPIEQMTPWEAYKKEHGWNTAEKSDDPKQENLYGSTKTEPTEPTEQMTPWEAYKKEHGWNTAEKSDDPKQENLYGNTENKSTNNSPNASDTDGDTVVYVTATGDKYHRSDCGHLRSKFKTTLLDAVIAGYDPCEHCAPPIYTGVIPTEVTEPTQKKANGSRSSSSSAGNGTSNRGNRTATAKTSVSDSDSSNAADIVLLVIFGLIFGLPLLVWVLLSLWLLWQKTRIYQRHLLRQKKKALQGQLIALSAKYAAFIDSRKEHSITLHRVRIKTASEISTIETLHQCKPDADSLPINKEAPTLYDKYGKDFTVTIGRTRYHRTTCHHATTYQYHISKLSPYATPCKRCNPPRVEAWMIRYIILNKKQSKVNSVLSFPFSEDYNGRETASSVLDTINLLQQRISHLPEIKK